MGNVIQHPWTTKGHGGVTEITLAELRSRCRRLLSSETYLANLEKALINRTCPPAIESMLYGYAYGRPQENIQLSVGPKEDLSQMTVEELAVRAKELTQKLEEAQALQDALPTEFRIDDIA